MIRGLPTGSAQSLRRKPHPAVGFGLAFLAGLLPLLGPPVFPETFEPARWFGAFLAGGAAAFEIRRGLSLDGAALQQRKRVVFRVLSMALPALFLLYAFRVVHLESGKGTLAVPLGLWRQSSCCSELDDVTCLRTRLSLTDGAIRKCWGDLSVSTVRFGLVLSYWGTALACGALIGLLWVRERPTEAALERETEPPPDAPLSSYHLFLSHAHEDRDFVRRLAADLQSRGLTVWWDELEVGVGESIRLRLEYGLKVSSRFAVVLSPESVQSFWVNREVDSAFFMAAKKKEQKSFIIPILYRTCDVPVLLGGMRSADFTISYERGLKELLSQLLSAPKEQEGFVVSSKIPISMLPDAMIFISHGSSDDLFVAELRGRLEVFQIPVWVDSRNMRGSNKLAPEIEVAIEQARHCVIVLSPSTVNSPWVRREIAKALEVEENRRADGYRVIPLLLPGIERQALGTWFDEEPATQPIEVGAAGLSTSLPALLAALGSARPQIAD